MFTITAEKARKKTQEGKEAKKQEYLDICEKRILKATEMGREVTYAVYEGVDFVNRKEDKELCNWIIENLEKAGFEAKRNCSNSIKIKW